MSAVRSYTGMQGNPTLCAPAVSRAGFGSLLGSAWSKTEQCSRPVAKPQGEEWCGGCNEFLPVPFWCI